MAPDMHHVDRKSLYTSLEARIDYLHKFLDWDDRDIEALAYGAQHIQNLIPAVVHIIYHKLSEFDITARAFEVRNTSSESPSKDELSSDSSLLMERQNFLNSYLTKMSHLSKGSSDQSKMAFWEYLDSVGAMHVGLQKSRELRIDYIHISLTLSLIQSVMSQAILDHSSIPISRRAAIVKSFSKVIWIQNDLFARWYVRDGEEFPDNPAVARIQVPRGNGTAGVTAGTTTPGTAPAAPAGPSTCPFSGMSGEMKELKVGH
ncbi:hypothetical protein N0V84_009432 [Fusarium piperis]|uniref:Globin-sensor domain-containing protein n=1 Tax=Fusarium piperis TaxID=1435070 RepID=A0A9W8W6E1_9HYPO|nr:hypothetical protein N0V84_009432 [Fusarium piperis]